MTSLPSKVSVRAAHSGNYPLATGNWVKLAKVSATSGGMVPAKILKIATDVIRGREAAARWYSTQRPASSAELAADNECDVFFIDVLKDVYSVPSCSHAPRLWKKPRASRRGRPATTFRTSNLPSQRPCPTLMDCSKSSNRQGRLQTTPFRPPRRRPRRITTRPVQPRQRV